MQGAGAVHAPGVRAWLPAECALAAPVPTQHRSQHQRPCNHPCKHIIHIQSCCGMPTPISMCKVLVLYMRQDVVPGCPVKAHWLPLCPQSIDRRASKHVITTVSVPVTASLR